MAKKVLVLAGGFSAERDVSLVSGRGVAEALKEREYEVVEHDLTDGFDLVRVLEREKPDAVFNALHGNFGEDGEVQGLLDLLQVPYTHSGLKASAIGMDKELTKQAAESIGIKTAPGERLSFAAYQAQGSKISLPYVVKPVSDGSSVGVFIVRSADDAKKIHYDNPERELLIEKFIPGQELTVAVLNGKALGVTEMRTEVEFYDYEAKYTDGVTRHILPAEIPAEAAQTAQDYAERLHRYLGCNTVSRCDFRYNPEDGVVLLEINTNPGLTPLSLVPEQAKYNGISYPELCALLVEEAKCRSVKENI